MLRNIFDGKALSSIILSELSQEIQKTQKEKLNSSYPKLAYVFMGSNSSVLTYLSIKKRACEFLKIEMSGFYFPEATPLNELKKAISHLNQDPSIHGILVQLPLSPSINEQEVIDSVIPYKDVDGLHSFNLASLSQKLSIPLFYPCTPKGCIEILKRNNIQIEGKHAVVIGRSSLAGMSLALMLQKENATVTICHSKTANLEKFTEQADILAVAVGKPGLISEEMVKEGVVVLDIGISKTQTEILGDVQPSVAQKAGFFTPVPGGVGPMTVAMLMTNLVEAWKRSLNTFS
jgi:methylenetetrahydrofolate dehydrogenase (NADP+)/methenyltetrahydrofolate cyclohydrolase